GDRVVRTVESLPDVREHPGESLRGVDRLQEDTFSAGQQPDGVQALSRWNGIPRTNVPVLTDQVFPAQGQIDLQPVRRPLDDRPCPAGDGRAVVFDGNARWRELAVEEGGAERDTR